MCQRMQKFFFLLLVLFTLHCFGVIVCASAIEDDPACATETVNNITTLSDGTYTPEAFSFSGGTGKVKITCSEVRIENGRSFAEIRFSSSSYSYVKADGKIFYADTADGASTFFLPVELNRNNRILGTTTKMSTPHEIEYSFFIQLSSDGTEYQNEDRLDDLPPAVMGLSPIGSEEISHAERLRIFRYEDGIALLEIDTGRDPIPTVITSDDEPLPSDYLAALYHRRVLKYLVFPPDAEIPAGLEKDFIIIRKPVSHLFAATQSILDAVGSSESVAAIGFDPSSEIFAGTLDKPDYKMLVLKRIDLILGDDSLCTLLSGTLADRLAALGIPAIPDCSVSESDPGAAEDRAKICSILLEDAQ